MIFCSDCVRSSSVAALLHLLADDGCEGELNRGWGRGRWQRGGRRESFYLPFIVEDKAEGIEREAREERVSPSTSTQQSRSRAHAGACSPAQHAGYQHAA